MLLYHFILKNYEKNDPHPIAHALLHWLACGALTVATWLVAVLIFIAIY